MRHEEFQEVLGRRLKLTAEVLGAKSKEYASDADRLHNFKAAARLCGVSPETALMGMLVKHWVSIRDMVDRFERTGLVPSRELVDEKVGDAVNYLVLLEALFTEVRGDSQRR
jgi:hypothetical protein